VKKINKDGLHPDSEQAATVKPTIKYLQIRCEA